MLLNVLGTHGPTAVSGTGGGSVPPVFESHVDAHTVGNATSLVIAKPSGLVSGELIALHMIADGNGSTPTFTWPAGFFEEYDEGTSDNAIAHGFAWKVAGGSEPADYTPVSSLSTVMCGISIRISGINVADPISSFATANSLAGDTTVVFTPDHNDVLVLGLGGADKNIASTLTPPTEQSTVLSDSNGGAAGCIHCFSHENRGAVQQISRLFDVNSAVEETIAALVAIRPA